MVPFAEEHQLSSGSVHDVLGNPRIAPTNANPDPDKLWAFLASEVCSDDLDKVAPKLWIMSKQDSRNISPLHRQRVKRRTVVVTEDPKLHLVWHHDRIFIKPLPRYLTSHAFWETILCPSANHQLQESLPQSRVRKAALGYLRTYRYLIQHESDFRIAQSHDLGLVPADVSWQQFCAFAADLDSIKDRDVAQRYVYGEIRLTRLNLYAPILLGKSHFQRVEYQYAAYFARFFAPLLFLFGIASVILGGLQIVVSVKSYNGDRSRWADAALGVAVMAILATTSIALGFGVVWVYKIAREWKFALRDRQRLLEEKQMVD